MISIPAPARGRTIINHPFFAVGLYFNSRPREGANAVPAGMPTGRLISIPAPARGRTPKEFLARYLELISIPAPARGRTWKIFGSKSTLQFQFPPPRGGERPDSRPLF